VLRFVLVATLLATPAPAADHWTEYRSGPFHVFSDAGDRPARERLDEMEQLRYALGSTLDKKELDTVFPVDVVLFSNARQYGPHALPQPFVDGGSATLSAWSADTALPRDWLRALTRLLIDQNAGRMPESIENAVCDLFSTIQINGTKVSVGAPLPAGELPPDRLRAWAKLQLLATNPDYSGKLRVYLNNLQQGGDEDAAVRNAFDLTLPKLNALVDASVRAGNFAPAPVSGRALNPSRDFIEKPVETAAMNALFAELAAGGRNFPPDSPRGLLEKGTRPALELAVKANPRWAEPHVRLAALETNVVAKVMDLKTATTLEPRNAAYWQALAEAQAAANLYTDAAKSWSAAEHAAPNDAERARIHQARLDLDERRADFDAAEKKRTAMEQAAELQRIKDAAAAEVHAAEAAANQQLGSRPRPENVVAWWDNPRGEKVAGTLTRVDCLGGPLRLTIQKDGGAAVRLLIRDPSKLIVEGTNEATLGCGVQKPVRKIRLQHDAKPDAKLGTAGDVAVVEFP
jgi:hypothetical protein